MTRPAHLLVVDDHDLFCEALSRVLQGAAGIGRVDCSRSVGAAVAAFTSSRPDVVLVDLDLDGEDGRDLLPTTTAADPPVPTVLMSGVTDARTTAEAFAAGARGWVSKEAPVPVLLAGLAQVQSGHRFVCPGTLDVLVDELTDLVHTGAAPPPRDSFLDRLTPRQMDVLRCLMTGMTKAEVAQALFLSSNTVRTHVQNLMAAAGVHSTAGLVSKARAAGADAGRPLTRAGPR